MLRELRKEPRDGNARLADLAAALVICLVAAFAVMEARYGVADSLYAPIAAAQPQTPTGAPSAVH
jgi:hypothetical protein